MPIVTDDMLGPLGALSELRGRRIDPQEFRREYMGEFREQEGRHESVVDEYRRRNIAARDRPFVPAAQRVVRCLQCGEGTLTSRLECPTCGEVYLPNGPTLRERAIADGWAKPMSIKPPPPKPPPTRWELIAGGFMDDD